jgi:hypothetical protein
MEYTFLNHKDLFTEIKHFNIFVKIAFFIAGHLNREKTSYDAQEGVGVGGFK